MFVCKNCGEKMEVYSRHCPMCRGDKTLEKQLALPESQSASQLEQDNPKFSCGSLALDKLMGGGFEATKTYFWAAEPGIGKTTEALQCCANMVKQGLVVIYFTGEETKKGLLKKAGNFGILENLPEIIEVDSITEVAAIVREKRPTFFVLDSIQTMTGGNTDRPTYAMQTHISLQLLKLARNYNCGVVAIGQVNQDKRASGPMALGHNFDVVTILQKGVNEEVIFSTPEKNRLGPTDNRAVFRMTASGLVEKSEVECGYTLRHDDEAAIGIASFITDSLTGFSSDEITTTFDSLVAKPRLTLDGGTTSQAKVIVSVILRFFDDFEPRYVVRANRTEKLTRNSDLACVVALLSDFYRKPIPHNVAFVATFDAFGKLLMLPNITARVKRAKEQGYSRVFGPRGLPGQPASWEETSDIRDVWTKLGF
jgi:DNA repair protein RadA/Sms